MKKQDKSVTFVKYAVFLLLLVVVCTAGFFVYKNKFPSKKTQPTTVNLQVTEYKNPDALKKVMGELESRGIKKATIFIGGDFAANNCSLVKEYDGKGYEIALFGYALDKDGNFVQLATLSKAEQEVDIKKDKESLENCLGHKVLGFRAQRFSQNDDTNQIIKSLGFEWNASFVTGSSTLPENPSAILPYKSSQYGFYVVSMIGAEVSTGRVSALCDAALNSVVDSKGWSDTVKKYYKDYSQENLPFITEFHPYFLVTDDKWWGEFTNLLNWLKAQKPNFATTKEMIDVCTFSACQE